MSDPMTNAEVEDILSSIRRLVSEDTRKDRAAEAAPEPPIDRLVLTPALRVEDTTSAPDDSEAESDSGDDAEYDGTTAAEAFPDATVTAEDAFDRLNGALSDAEPIEEAGFIEVEPEEAPSAVVTAFAPAEETADTAQADVADADTPISVFDEPQTFEWAQPEVAEVGVEEAEASEHDEVREALEIVTDTSDDDLDEIEDSLESSADADQVTADDSDAIAELHALEPGPEHFEPQEDLASIEDSLIEEISASDAEADAPTPPVEDAQDVSTAGLSQSLGDKIAALETLLARRTDGFEPDDMGADDYAGTAEPAVEWQDATVEDMVGFDASDADTDEPLEFEEVFDEDEDEPEAEYVEETPETQQVFEEDHLPCDSTLAEDDADFLASDETLIDEETLRDLISDIVREELQGALGERITRNVRKLVRREIHRALAAQDLD